MSALHDLIMRGNDFETLRELLEEGENPNVTDIRGNTPLHVAVFKEVENAREFEANLKVVRELIYFRADVNQTNNHGSPPLHFAVIRRNHKMMEILLNCDAEVNMQDDLGNSALHYAINSTRLIQRTSSNSDCETDCLTTDLEAVKLLMKYSPDINLFNFSFETPLVWAVKQQNLEVVEMLLEKKAIVTLKDRYRNIVLHHALDRTQVNAKIVAELIRCGSSHDSRNGELKTPVDVYLNRLHSASFAEQEKAKHLFKLFVFQQNTFKMSQFREIAIISKKFKSFLSQFFWYCRFEIEQMKSDELAKNYTVYDLAWRGFYSRSAENDPLSKIFHAVIDKLTNGEYTVYSDMIISAISKQYLANKTAETGHWMNKKGEQQEFLNFDLRYFLCYYYLTNFEIFGLMLAFSSNGSFSKICNICYSLNETL